MAVSKTGQVTGYLLIVSRTMTPLIEITFHLVCRLAHQFVSFFACRHCLQLLKDLKQHLAVMAYRNLCHRILERFGLGGYLGSPGNIIGPIDIELEIAHDSQMVPEFLLIVRILAVLWEHTVHNDNNGLSTSLALLSVRKAYGIVNHLLHFPSIFGQYQLLPLGVVV